VRVAVGAITFVASTRVNVTTDGVSAWEKTLQLSAGADWLVQNRFGVPVTDTTAAEVAVE
jgi:hypothetical protein